MASNQLKVRCILSAKKIVILNYTEKRDITLFKIMQKLYDRWNFFSVFIIIIRKMREFSDRPRRLIGNWQILELSTNF